MKPHPRDGTNVAQPAGQLAQDQRVASAALALERAAGPIAEILGDVESFDEYVLGRLPVINATGLLRLRRLPFGNLELSLNARSWTQSPRDPTPIPDLPRGETYTHATTLTDWLSAYRISNTDVQVSGTLYNTPFFILNPGRAEVPFLAGRDATNFGTLGFSSGNMRFAGLRANQRVEFDSGNFAALTYTWEVPADLWSYPTLYAQKALTHSRLPAIPPFGRSSPPYTAPVGFGRVTPEPVGPRNGWPDPDGEFIVTGIRGQTADTVTTFRTTYRFDASGRGWPTRANVYLSLVRYIEFGWTEYVQKVRVGWGGASPTTPTTRCETVHGPFNPAISAPVQLEGARNPRDTRQRNGPFTAFYRIRGVIPPRYQPFTVTLWSRSPYPQGDSAETLYFENRQQTDDIETQHYVQVTGRPTPDRTETLARAVYCDGRDLYFEGHVVPRDVRIGYDGVVLDEPTVPPR